MRIGNRRRADPAWPHQLNQPRQSHRQPFRTRRGRREQGVLQPLRFGGFGRHRRALDRAARGMGFQIDAHQVQQSARVAQRNRQGGCPLEHRAIGQFQARGQARHGPVAIPQPLAELFQHAGQSGRERFQVADLPIKVPARVEPFRRLVRPQRQAGLAPRQARHPLALRPEALDQPVFRQPRQFADLAEAPATQRRQFPLSEG